MFATIQKGTEIIVIQDGIPWSSREHYRKILTKQDNSFEQDEQVIFPDTIRCTHNAADAKMIGMAYAALGFIGFRKGGYVVMTFVDNVLFHGESGDYTITLEQLEREAGVSHAVLGEELHQL